MNLALGVAAAIAVGSLTALLTGAKASDGDYRDTSFGVAVTVPTGWKITSQTDDSMLTLRLFRPEPEFRSEDCKIIVIKSPATLRQSQAEIDREFRGDKDHLSVKALLTLIPNATQQKHKWMNLRGRTTLFVESTFGPGETTRSYQAAFAVPGRSFDGLCVARPAHYAQQKPIYQRILHSMSAIE